MIALTSRPARGRSSNCRGHLGRNATILPVIKLLIRLRRADFGSSFKESPSRLPFLLAANASLSNPWREKPKVRNHRWSSDSVIEASCDPALSHFTHLLSLNRKIIPGWDGDLLESTQRLPSLQPRGGNSVFAKQSGFIFGEGEVVLIGMKGINW